MQWRLLLGLQLVIFEASADYGNAFDSQLTQEKPSSNINFSWDNVRPMSVMFFGNNGLSYFILSWE